MVIRIPFMLSVYGQKMNANRKVVVNLLAFELSGFPQIYIVVRGCKEYMYPRILNAQFCCDSRDSFASNTEY